MRPGCPDDLAPLLAYWLGELGEDEAAFEEHLFDCAVCTARLREVARLGAGIADLAARGRVFASVTVPHVERARRAGLRLRTYRLAPEESVACTIAPNDDANVVELEASFRGVERVRLDVLTVENGRETLSQRFEDLPVDRASGTAVLLYPGEAIRALGASTFRLQLLAEEPGGERSLGSYTLHHSPWPG